MQEAAATCISSCALMSKSAHSRKSWVFMIASSCVPSPARPSFSKSLGLHSATKLHHWTILHCCHVDLVLCRGASSRTVLWKVLDRFSVESDNRESVPDLSPLDKSFPFGFFWGE